MWKLFLTVVSTFACDAMQEHTDDTRALLCGVPSLIRRTTQRLKAIRDGTFGIVGLKLFNCFSGNFAKRGKTNDTNLLGKLRRKLDTVLPIIPGKPRLPSYPSIIGAIYITTQVEGEV